MNDIETCPLEDFLLYQSKSMPIFGLIHGLPQMGKSTFFYTLANNLSLLRSDYKEEWDYKKYCARSLHELIEMYKIYDHAILGYEEAQKEINTINWRSELEELFSQIIETQGYKKNLLFLVLPCGLTIPNRNRRMINIGIEVLSKNEDRMTAKIKTTVYNFRYWKLDEFDIWYNHLLGSTNIHYNKEQLTHAKEYTDWLIRAKEVILENISNRIKDINDPYRFVKEIGKNETEIVKVNERNHIKPLF